MGTLTDPPGSPAPSAGWSFRSLPLAAASFDRGEYRAALAHLDRVSPAEASPGFVLLCRGLTHWAAEDFARGAADLEQAELQVPLPQPAYCVLAECHLRLGRRHPARAVLVNMVPNETLPDEVLGPLARGLFFAAEYERSMFVCRLAARRYPEADEPLWWLAQNLAALDRPPFRRLSILLKARRLAPEDGRYAKALAFLYADLGDFKLARQYALTIPPEWLECVACRARVRSIFEAARGGNVSPLGRPQESPFAEPHADLPDTLFADGERPRLSHWI